MANTFTQIYLHIVFAVQNRTSLVQPGWKDELYKYITGIVQNNGHKLIAINGTPNHLHIAVGYKPHQPIPDLLQDIKGYSSKWINEKRFVRGKFNPPSRSASADEKVGLIPRRSAATMIEKFFRYLAACGEEIHFGRRVMALFLFHNHTLIGLLNISITRNSIIENMHSGKNMLNCLKCMKLSMMKNIL